MHDGNNSAVIPSDLKGHGFSRALKIYLLFFERASARAISWAKARLFVHPRTAQLKLCPFKTR